VNPSLRLTWMAYEVKQIQLEAKLKYKAYLQRVLSGKTPTGYKPASFVYLAEATLSLIDVCREIKALQR
jgi:hypothetical protein